MTSILDKSLDEIIKDERKAKRKEMQQKKKLLQQKKQKTQQQGAKNRNNQQQRNKGPNAQKNRQQNRGGQQGGNKTKGVLGRTRPNQGTSGNKQTGGGKPRMLANRLKNKQPLKNTGRQMTNRIKKAQANRNQNRQNQQMRQKDARQNILDRRRGIQNTNQGQGNQRGNNNNNNNNRRNKNRQNLNQPQQRQQPVGQRKNNFKGRQARGPVNELRVSVANVKQQPRFQNQPRKNFSINRNAFASGRTSTTLNDRFSGRKVMF